jgi:hypothetical protein
MSQFTAIFSDPLSEESKRWSQNHFATMIEGGSWGVPRSGLIFQKRGNKLICILRMPHDPKMPLTAEQLKEQQDTELRGIRKSFEAIGVTVVDESSPNRRTP